ncbi:MAG TPA: PAS domain S-box protein [Candidatus Omnitrophota bacterium]|nr:PAS domain S-box protein [Candidatus Omnitrophota bacterium]HPS20588.1 PAS domain S-box protein [Candidatus Omnitrophota bacterium]
MIIQISHIILFTLGILTCLWIIQHLNKGKNIGYLLDHAKIGYIKFSGQDGTILSINKGMMHILDINPTASETVGSNVDEYIVVEPGRKNFTEETKNRENVRHDTIFGFRTLAGKEKYVRLNFIKETGQVSSRQIIEGLVEDITSEREFYRNMMELEEKYEKLFVNSGDMVILYEPKEHIIEEINPVSEFLLGYGREQVVGAVFETLMHPDYRKEFQNKQKDLLLKGTEHAELVLVCGDGEYRQVSMTMSTFEFKGAQKCMTMIKDLTSYVREREELKQRKDDLEKICDAAIEREERINELRLEIEELKRNKGLLSQHKEPGAEE